jgi:Tol biopolymer transport system component
MLKYCLLFYLVVSFSLATAQIPVLFMEGVVSTDLNERDMAISPDGNDMYYTVQTSRNIMSTILHRKKLPTGWSGPEVASFSGTFNDLEPAFSPDGKKLFFCSNRPINGDKTKDFDIWMIERTAGGWSEPKNLGSPINTSANEFYPSIARNGNLYFTAEKEGAVGNEDIFVSAFENGVYASPVPLDTAINSKLWEFNAFIAPDESYIIFTSYGRKDDSGGGDLYISTKQNKKWSPARNLTSINSTTIDYCPFVFDGTLYFTSGRHHVTSARQQRMDYASLSKWYRQANNGSENIYAVPVGELIRE